MNDGADEVYRAGKDEEIDVGGDDDVGRCTGLVERVEGLGYYGEMNGTDVDATNVNVVCDDGYDGDVVAD
jgi:fatty acid/phospholipid biosynthesis enzyme